MSWKDILKNILLCCERNQELLCGNLLEDVVDVVIEEVLEDWKFDEKKFQYICFGVVGVMGCLLGNIVNVVDQVRVLIVIGFVVVEFDLVKIEGFFVVD